MPLTLDINALRSKANQLEDAKQAVAELTMQVKALMDAKAAQVRDLEAQEKEARNAMRQAQERVRAASDARRKLWGELIDPELTKAEAKSGATVRKLRASIKRAEDEMTDLQKSIKRISPNAQGAARTLEREEKALTVIQARLAKLYEEEGAARRAWDHATTMLERAKLDALSEPS